MNPFLNSIAIALISILAIGALAHADLLTEYGDNHGGISSQIYKIPGCGGSDFAARICASDFRENNINPNDVIGAELYLGDDSTFRYYKLRSGKKLRFGGMPG